MVHRKTLVLFVWVSAEREATLPCFKMSLSSGYHHIIVIHSGWMHKHTSERDIEVLTKSKKHHKFPTIISSRVTWTKWFVINRNQTISQFAIFGISNKWNGKCKYCILIAVVQLIVNGSVCRISKLAQKNLEKKVQIPLLGHGHPGIYRSSKCNSQSSSALLSQLNKQTIILDTNKQYSNITKKYNTHFSN